MTFFDTVAGQRFTEGTLPRLVSELEKLNAPGKQYVKTYNPYNLQKSIEEELNKGSEVVSMVPADSKIVIVYKTKE